MTKDEFLNHVNELLPQNKKISAITDKEYSVIEKVYTFHPSISDKNGKADIAKLYVMFGWAVIMDMLPRAELMAKKERELVDAKLSVLAVQQDMYIIKNGGWL